MGYISGRDAIWHEYQSKSGSGVLRPLQLQTCKAALEMKSCIARLLRRMIDFRAGER